MSDPTSSSVVVTLDLAGIFVFAVSGGLTAVRKDLDVFGVLVLATVTGLGGGILRDVLIGVEPPASLDDWRYLVVPVVAGLVAFRFPATVGRLESVIIAFDAAGLALFCATGAITASDAGLGPVPATLLGLITAVGGGMLRDVLAGRVPIVLRSEIYAVPAVAGAAVAVTLHRLDTGDLVAAGAAFAVCFGWRMLAVRRNWQAPRSYTSSS
jgi:uncharacterized membrane protein YeiH